MSAVQICFKHFSILTFSSFSMPNKLCLLILYIHTPTYYLKFLSFNHSIRRSLLSLPLSLSSLHLHLSTSSLSLLLLICIHISLSPYLAIVLANPLKRCLNPSLSIFHPSLLLLFFIPSLSFFCLHIFLQCLLQCCEKVLAPSTFISILSSN